MLCHQNNLMGESTLAFPRTGFWIVHILGGLFLISLGMRLVVRKAPVPLLVYRLFKMLR
ncbi:hypothetical protein M7775_11300 [Sporomusa sphaeroides DSM 2875]|uniref:hypothetical protein n=1 Tax=Sporomusa sphaeroides TaxID=47679 RepID=UPI002030641C|nr:hypothetical protein [Sporomusa sphaeroides]MCM0759150.1 hypothetical protein [Sporomusa sphaeroides DSM 2875]